MSSFKESLSPLLWAYRLVGLTIFELPENVYWLKSSVVYATTLALSYSYVLWYKFNFGTESAKLIPLVTVIFRMILILNIIAAVGSSIIFWLNLKVYNHFNVHVNFFLNYSFYFEIIFVQESRRIYQKNNTCRRNITIIWHRSTIQARVHRKFDNIVIVSVSNNFIIL